MKPRITLLESQDIKLRKFLDSHPKGHERAAIVLFRRLHRPIQGLDDSDRYIAVDVIPFVDDWIVHSSSAHVNFDLKYLRDAFRRCEEEKLVFGFAHNHPTGYPDFSETDEENERTLLQAIVNRNGRNIHFVALLLTNGQWKARVRHGESPHPISTRHTLVLGDHLTMYGYEESEYDDDTIHARQAAAFGQPFVDMLRSLRVGIVGCGGTGSPTITLLARAGIGELVLIDNDLLEKTNLNRVRGSRLEDVGKNKALILGDFIRSLGLSVQISTIQSLIDEDPNALDAISSCDVIFGCTDDQLGREVLNTSLYVYAQALIDIGLGGQIAQDKEGQPYLRYHQGRISTVLPEAGECLLCQGVIKDKWIRHQQELRKNPDLSIEEAEQRYLEGSGEQAPGVGPFTSATADNGVANLFNLLRPFRRIPGHLREDLYFIDFVKMEIWSKESTNNSECPYCGTNDYLLLREKYRLNRPMLGKAHVYL